MRGGGGSELDLEMEPARGASCIFSATMKISLAGRRPGDDEPRRTLAEGTQDTRADASVGLLESCQTAQGAMLVETGRWGADTTAMQTPQTDTRHHRHQTHPQDNHTKGWKTVLRDAARCCPPRETAHAHDCRGEHRRISARRSCRGSSLQPSIQLLLPSPKPSKPSSLPKLKPPPLWCPALPWSLHESALARGTRWPTIDSTRQQFAELQQLKPRSDALPQTHPASQASLLRHHKLRHGLRRIPVSRRDGGLRFSH